MLVLILGFSPSPKDATLFSIPTQMIHPYQLLGDQSNNLYMNVNEFRISRFVTYLEYKEYLQVIEKDSSESFYFMQLPDTNIGPTQVHQEYIRSDLYDDLPVIAISWDNAMNFLKWKTLRDNKSDSITFIYRLPKGSEWLAAYSYLESQHINHDFDDLFSDWLLSTKDESYYQGIQSKEFAFDYYYFHKHDSPLALKRKLTLGDSFLFQRAKPLSYIGFGYYATVGFRHIGFRYVIDLITPANEQEEMDKLPYSILEMWGIQQERR